MKSRKCFAICCSQRRTPDNPVKLHSFPRNKQLCSEWVKRANNPSLNDKPLDKVAKSAFLCEHHFTDDQYVCRIKKKLHVGAMPSLFSLGNPSPTLHTSTPSTSDVARGPFPSTSNHSLSPGTVSPSVSLPKPHSCMSNVSSASPNPLPSDDDMPTLDSVSDSPPQSPASVSARLLHFPPFSTNLVPSDELRHGFHLQNCSIKKVSNMTLKKKLVLKNNSKLPEKEIKENPEAMKKVHELMEKQLKALQNILPNQTENRALNIMSEIASIHRKSLRNRSARRWQLKKKLIFSYLH